MPTLTLVALTSYWFLLAFMLFLLFSVWVGCKVGQWQMARHSQEELAIVNVAEGTVFALLGLLMAFSFTGAYDRFEVRKLHIIDEAVAYETAYLRLDLLPAASQPALRDGFRQYLDSRLLVYKRIPKDDSTFTDELAKSRNLQATIWSQIIVACKGVSDGTMQLVIQAANDMFDAAEKGLAITTIHPPLVIFLLLFGMAILGALLVGYSISEKEAGGHLHVLSYILLTSLTIFIITNLEFPRVGKIHIERYDKVLMQVRAEWK